MMSSEHGKWQRLNTPGWENTLESALAGLAEERVAVGWRIREGAPARRVEQMSPESEPYLSVWRPLQGAHSWPGGIGRVRLEVDDRWPDVIRWVIEHESDWQACKLTEGLRVVADDGSVWAVTSLHADEFDPARAPMPEQHELRVAWVALPPRRNTARQTDEHQRLIVDALRTLGYDPVYLPEDPKRTGPKGGIKRKVREHLKVDQKDERLTPSQFNEAWGALQKSGEIIYTG